MNKKKFIELATRYLSKEASHEEIEQLNNLLMQHEYKTLFNFIDQQWNAGEETKSNNTFDLERGLGKLTSKIKKFEPAFEWKEKKHSRIFILQPAFLRVAASIAVIFTIATAALYIGGVFNPKQISIAWNEKITVMGEKSIVTLLDGTKITLNADSKLKYPTRFGEESREVYLEGEGYFEVAHNSDKPFVVHTGNISTTDIGTAFNINAFADDKEIEVSLIEGSVKVSTNETGSAKGDIILEPTQQLVYNKENETNKVRTFDDQKAAGWKDNIFVFDNEPLSKVFIELERSFGIKFELTDKSYSSKKIKANFKNESIWTVAEVLKKATGLQYKTIKENNETKKIIFYKK
jgi:transmembrane sensor